MSGKGDSNPHQRRLVRPRSAFELLPHVARLSGLSPCLFPGAAQGAPGCTCLLVGQQPRQVRQSSRAGLAPTSGWDSNPPQVTLQSRSPPPWAAGLEDYHVVELVSCCAGLSRRSRPIHTFADVSMAKTGFGRAGIEPATTRQPPERANTSTKHPAGFLAGCLFSRDTISAR